MLSRSSSRQASWAVASARVDLADKRLSARQIRQRQAAHATPVAERVDQLVARRTGRLAFEHVERGSEHSQRLGKLTGADQRVAQVGEREGIREWIVVARQLG